MLISPCRTLGIEIPAKNASTTFDHVFLDWENHPSHLPELIPETVKDVIVILRDPRARFLSALNMFLNIDHPITRKIVNEKRFVATFPWLCNHGKEINSHDAHFAPQSGHIGGIRHKFLGTQKHVRFFYMSDVHQNDVCNDVLTWIRDYRLDITDVISHTRYRLNSTKDKLIEKVDNKLISHVYREDYKLLEEITRLRRWENFKNVHTLGAFGINFNGEYYEQG